MRYACSAPRRALQIDSLIVLTASKRSDRGKFSGKSSILIDMLVWVGVGMFFHKCHEEVSQHVPVAFQALVQSVPDFVAKVVLRRFGDTSLWDDLVHDLACKPRKSDRRLDVVVK